MSEQPSFLFDKMELEFGIFENEIIVHSKIFFERNKRAEKENDPLILYGNQNHFKLISIHMGEWKLQKNHIHTLDGYIIIPDVATKSSIKTSTIIEKIEKGIQKKGESIFIPQGMGLAGVTYCPAPVTKLPISTTIIANPGTFPVLIASGIQTNFEVIPGTATTYTKHKVMWAEDFPITIRDYRLFAGRMEDLSF